jgi:hypothetical protein
MGYVRRFWPLLLAVIVILGSAALVYWFHTWQSWAAYETGSRNTPGTPPNYNYWSGFGSVFPWSFGVITGILGLLYQHARKANCHTHGCWRVGSYPAGDYTVCKKHHREVHGTHPTIEHLKAHVEEVRNGRSCVDPGVDSGPGGGERPAGAEHVGGGAGHDQPADAAGDPEEPGL